MKKKYKRIIVEAEWAKVVKKAAKLRGMSAFQLLKQLWDNAGQTQGTK